MPGIPLPAKANVAPPVAERSSPPTARESMLSSIKISGG
jgi:hypothetical protein